MAAAGPKVKAPVNHWIVALTVTLATFMEVLDTSIANVALPLHRRRTFCRPEPDYLGAHQLPGRQRDRASAFRLAHRDDRPQAILHDLRIALHGQLGALRRRPNIELLIFFRVLQGIGGGGLQPSEQGILVDTFPVAAARHGDGHLRSGRGRRADLGPDIGGIYH